MEFGPVSEGTIALTWRPADNQSTQSGVFDLLVRQKVVRSVHLEASLWRPIGQCLVGATSTTAPIFLATQSKACHGDTHLKGWAQTASSDKPRGSAPTETSSKFWAVTDGNLYWACLEKHNMTAVASISRPNIITSRYTLSCLFVGSRSETDGRGQLLGLA
jgi:hypothetical protein